MKTSHEWPQPPPDIKSSSSRRRKLTHENLASVDWHKACRYESYSDGDDDLTTRNPHKPACQSSGYNEAGMGIQSFGAGDGENFHLQCAGYGKGDVIHSSDEDFHRDEVQEMQRFDYLQDHNGLGSAGYGVISKDFQSSGYGDGKGFVLPSTTTKFVSSDKDGNMKIPANHRAHHSSILPQQPLRLTTCAPFSGIFKHTEKPHAARFVSAAQVANIEGSTEEPTSPEVTCLGRVRIKEKHSHDTELHTLTERQTFRNLQRAHSLERQKQSMQDKNINKDGGDNGSNKKERRSCLPRIKRSLEDMELPTFKLCGPSPATVAPLETGRGTRRERAALLARSLTSLLEDLRRLDMENSGYVPQVPPPNSLLLMRGFGIQNKSPDLLDGNALQSEEAKRAGISHDIETQKNMKQMTTSAEKSKAAAPSKAKQIFPLSDTETNSFTQNALPFETMNKKGLPAMDNCPQELALWQRRAIAKLAAIDTKRPLRMEVRHPRTS